MERHRKLPIAEIEGVTYYVDAEREELWQVQNPENRITFSVFHVWGNGYRFLYNKKICNAARSKKEINEHLNEHCWVILPALMELDREGTALRYDIPLEALCPATMRPPPKKVIALIRPVNYIK